MYEITERTRKLRNNMTAAEENFWQAVRSRKLGVKFLRQKPLRFYVGNNQKYFIADFFCKELKLVVEIDGRIHLDQKEYDEWSHNAWKFAQDYNAKLNLKEEYLKLFS